MRSIKLKLCAGVLFLLALTAVGLYTEREMQQIRENRELIEQMEVQLAAMGEETLRKQRDLARWYNYNLALGTPGLEAPYGNILNLGNGIMAALEVPEMNVRLPVFHGENAIAGHCPDSDLPIGSRESHTILSLKEWYPWETGMTVYIDCLGRRTIYQVESVQVMHAGWSVEWPSQQERLTILSDRGGKRTIIRCLRTGELNVRESEERMDLRAAALVSVLMLLPAIPVKLRKKRRHQFFVSRKYGAFSCKNRRKSRL